jgi:hypothetical protein
MAMEQNRSMRGAMESSEVRNRRGGMGRTIRRHCVDAAGDRPLPTGATIVRGPDGKLYRVIVPPRSENAIPGRVWMSAFEDEGENTEEDVLPGEKCDVSTTESTDDGSDYSPEAERCSDSLLDGDSISGNPDTMSRQKRASSPRSILVEDVPDEEDKELLELRSVWRNRVPSPSQWMEPVESLCW